jgi:hypothetical protein
MHGKIPLAKSLISSLETSEKDGTTAYLPNKSWGYLPENNDISTPEDFIRMFLRVISYLT